MNQDLQFVLKIMKQAKYLSFSYRHYLEPAYQTQKSKTNLKHTITIRNRWMYLRFSTELHSKIVVWVHFWSKWDLRRLVVPHGQQTQRSKEAQTPTEPSQSFVLTYGVGDAINTGFGKRRAVVPDELVVYVKGSVGDDVFADRKAHAGAETKRRSDGTGDDSVSAHDLGSHTAQSPCHFWKCFFVFSFGNLNQQNQSRLDSGIEGKEMTATKRCRFRMHHCS